MLCKSAGDSLRQFASDSYIGRLEEGRRFLFQQTQGLIVESLSMEDLRFQDLEAPVPFALFGRISLEALLCLLEGRGDFAAVQLHSCTVVDVFGIQLGAARRSQTSENNQTGLCYNRDGGRPLVLPSTAVR